MKILRTRTNKAGNEEVTVELLPGERLVPIQTNYHYRLGHPVCDVVGSHVLATARKVVWCSISQQWVDS